MRMIRAALAAALLMITPALAQPAAQEQARRALGGAEAELRETIRRMDEGALPGSMAMSRLRQALNEVERAMLTLPAEARQGPNWQAAVRNVSEAMAKVREDANASPAEARAAAGEALSTIPALRGEETGSGGG